jgi:hypothetical protein
VTAISLNSATVKLTVSIKRRLGSGDEVFIAPGIEMHCAVEDLDATQESVTERVNGWMEKLLADYPDPADADDDEAEEAEDDAAEDDEEEAADDEEGLSEEDIAGMDKKALLALIKEQEIEIDGAAKMAVKALREAVIEALFSDDDGEEDGDEEEADEDAEDDEDGDGDDAGGYTEAELKAMKLEELQEICDTWEIDNPKLAKGADLKTKKAAYIKHILASQDAEE